MSLSRFITLEGIDGAGKSTHIEFIKEYFEIRSIPYILTREPGGTPTGELIRDILLRDEMSPITETLMMFASRSEHIASIIRPSLEKGLTVISDRFTDATYAYQHGGKQVSSETISSLKSLVQGSLEPDLTLLFDLPIEISGERLNKSRVLDRFEKQDSTFHQRVRETYLMIARKNKDRFKIIDSTNTINHIQNEISVILDNIYQ